MKKEKQSPPKPCKKSLGGTTEQGKNSKIDYKSKKSSLQMKLKNEQ